MLTTSFRPAAGTGSPRRLTMAQLLAEAVERRPDGVALVDGVADPTPAVAGPTANCSARRANGAVLLETFDPGDRVALWAPNSADWVCFQIGAGLAGIVLVTVNPAYREAELAHVLRQSRAGGLYFAAGHRGRDLRRIAGRGARPSHRSARRGQLDELWPARTRSVPAASPSDAGRHRADPVHVGHTGRPRARC